MGFCLVAQVVEHDARLDTGNSLLWIELDDLIHVLAEIEQDGDVTALSRQAGARASRQDGRAKFSAGSNGADDVGGVSRNDQPNRDLTIV